MKKHYKTKQAEKKTYYDELDDSCRSLVIWLDSLLMRPEDIYKMHRHIIHTMEMRACMANGIPIHKDKKINKWIGDKIYEVVKIHRIHEMNNEHDE